MSVQQYLESKFHQAAEGLVQMHAQSGSDDEVGLVFPMYRGGELRVSEQEAKVLFLHGVLTERRYRVAVEKPTKGEFSFTGDGRRSAQVDVALITSGYEADILIEFKADNRATGIQKDIEKLIREEKTGGWFHTLGSANRGTLPSLAAKFKNALAALRHHLAIAEPHDCLFTFCIIANKVLLSRWLPLGGKAAFDVSTSAFDDLALDSKSWSKQVLRSETRDQSSVPTKLVVEETNEH